MFNSHQLVTTWLPATEDIPFSMSTPPRPCFWDVKVCWLSAVICALSGVSRRPAQIIRESVDLFLNEIGIYLWRFSNITATFHVDTTVYLRGESNLGFHKQKRTVASILLSPETFAFVSCSDWQKGHGCLLIRIFTLSLILLTVLSVSSRMCVHIQFLSMRHGTRQNPSN